MAEYINREEFIQHIEESDLPDMAKRAVIALVRHMPATDVVEVGHGEWVCECEPHYTCSNCKHWFHLFGQTNYCPNCGAKMDGGNEDA